MLASKFLLIKLF